MISPPPPKKKVSSTALVTLHSGATLLRRKGLIIPLLSSGLFLSPKSQQQHIRSSDWTDCVCSTAVKTCDINIQTNMFCRSPSVMQLPSFGIYSQIGIVFFFLCCCKQSVTWHASFYLFIIFKCLFVQAEKQSGTISHKDKCRQMKWNFVRLSLQRIICIQCSCIVVFRISSMPGPKHHLQNLIFKYFSSVLRR